MLKSYISTIMTKTKRIGKVVRALTAILVSAAPAWNPDDLQDSDGKSFMLRFLPYLDPMEEGVFGYVPAFIKRGRGYGRWEEFFHTQQDAQARMQHLISLKAIEDAEILKMNRHGGGTLVDEYKDEGTTED